MKVVDCFTFAFELDMLEIRLRYLDPVVDKFVIVESNKTFSGKDKPYVLEENKERFAPFLHKIVHIAIEQVPEEFTFNKVDSYTPSDGAFQMEYQMRNALAYANSQIEDDDIVLIGDVDEIPLRENISFFTNHPAEILPATYRMSYHAGFLNNRCVQGPDQNWAGTIVCKGHQFKLVGPQEMRDHRNHYRPLYDTGMHFSFQGGIEAIQRKIQSFAHTEFNRDYVLDPQRIHNAIENGEDVLGRSGVRYKLDSMEEFPEDIRTILFDYPHLIKTV